jgi:sterol desaturase/sphingolipid hydroxylase (fatty acid hydroxylase superfamily)
VWSVSIALTLGAVWLLLIGGLDLLRAGVLWNSMRGAESNMVGPALLVVVGLVFLAERIWPAVPRPALSRPHLVDAGYLGLYALVGPVVTLLNTGFALTTTRYAHFLVLRRLPLAPKALVVALVLIGIDAMNWAAHNANHRFAALWRFHALHHSQEDMSVFTTFRTHPLAHASYLPAVLPALVLGASGPMPATALIVYGCLVTLPHANLRWTYGPLGAILVSPAFHRLHHASGPVGGKRAVNFGFVLTCWDRLAGCAAYPKDAPCPTGIAGRTVPVEQTAKPWNAWRTVAAQLVQPFRPSSGLEGR